MKYLSLISFLAVVTAWGALGRASSGGGAQERFNEANQLYQRHAYDSAATLYQQLVDEGYDNPELFYNAGNACLKARRLGYAVYFYEKALEQSPDNAVIRHNLAMAHEQATDKIDQIPTLFFIRWWHQLLRLHPPNGWMAGSILACWILVFFVGWRLIRAPAPRWTRWAVVVAALGTAFYFAGAYGSWHQHTHRTYGVVVGTDEPLKTTPDDGSPELMTVHEGLKVRITDEVNGWRKIRLTDGKEGWIPQKAVLIL